MPTYQLQVFGEKQLAAKFERQAHLFGDARPAFNEIANFLRARADKRFQEQGPGWDPISAKWAKRKGSTRILIQTGALRKSVTKSRARGSMTRITKHTMVFGTKLPYAARHQFGHEQTPARPFLFTTAEDRREIRNIMFSYLAQPFNRRARGHYIPRFTNLPRR